MGWVRCATAVLLAVVALTACGTGSPPRGRTGTTDDAVPVTAEVFAGEYGVEVGVRVWFTEDRVLTRARVLWAGGQADARVYPDDGTSPDQPPDPLALPAGTRALLQGSVLVACPDTPTALLFEVDSDSDGGSHTDRYLVDEPERVARAFARWCRRPAVLHVTRVRESPEGAYVVTVELTNPGPHAVLLSAEPSLGDGTAWEGAQVVVPAGTRTALTVRGHGPPRCAARPPWAEGHLLVDGRPIRPAGGDWC